MKYKYKFADDTETEVEVAADVYNVLRQLDRQERYNNEKHRNISYDEMEESGIEYSRSYDDIWETLQRKEREEREELRAEYRKYQLEDIKRQLLKLLTLQQAKAYFYSKYAKMKNVHIAKKMDITEGAVRKLVLKAETNLLKLGIDKIGPSAELRLLKAIFFDKLDEGYEY